MTTVLKAHGHLPAWEKGGKNQLSAESRAAYRAINLKFHDLRRESGSRVLESGSSLVKLAICWGTPTSARLRPTCRAAKSLGLAIEKKERYEQQLAEARRDVALPGGNIRGFLPGNHQCCETEHPTSR